MAKILIVDDSTFERKVLGDLLSKEGYADVMEAEDGQKGLAMYSTEKPDLTLLDIRMPGISGVEVLEKIISDNPSAKVLMVSIIRDQESIDECLRLGAKGYINKPVTAEKLIPKVKELIG
jgi:two-component system, chemotaxis family, chemotaxis protein CheY